MRRGAELKALREEVAHLQGDLDFLHVAHAETKRKYAALLFYGVVTGGSAASELDVLVLECSRDSAK